jgi:RNase adaptor protein for sRNA GlmZ degradation
MKIIEVGGTKRKCIKSTVPPHLTVSVPRGSLQLPNPHTAIKKGQLGESHQEIMEWLRAQEGHARKVDRLIQYAESLLQTHDRIRIECVGGKHRSQVIAREVAKRFLGSRVELLDAAALKE